MKGLIILALLLAGAAQAAGTSGQDNIERIVHRPDRVVMVYRALFYQQRKDRSWENPDLCDEDRKVALVPGDLEPPEVYAEQLATLRDALMHGKQVSFGLDGCYALDSGDTVPRIKLISVYR